ncbi:MAG: phytanoyl-CoA dioxygenase family protein [Halioglobus sp.]|nr:phytanoyl-CoA dioxygenase family protein [Halioglobus sp.]
MTTSNENAMYAASEMEMAQFNSQGFFVRESVFGAEELDLMRHAVEDIHASINQAAASNDAPPMQLVDDKRYQALQDSVVKWEWSEGSSDIRSMEPFLHLHPDLENLVDDQRLWMPAKSVLGLDQLSLFTDKLNFKRPGGAPFPFHQDSPYFALDCKHVEQLVSMQIYMDNATAENGCLWMVPGSHKNGILPCVQGKGVLDRLYTDMERFQGQEPVPIEVPAGSVIFFHVHVIHGSKGNHTDESRRAMVLTFQPPNKMCWKANRARPIKM